MLAPCQRSAASSAPPVRAHAFAALMPAAGRALPRSPRSVTAVLVNVYPIVPTTASEGPGSRSTGARPVAYTRPNPDQRDHLLDGRVSALTSAHRRAVGLSLSKSAGWSCTRITACGVEPGAQPRDPASAHWRRPAHRRADSAANPLITLMALFGQQRRIQFFRRKIAPLSVRSARSWLIKDRQLVLHWVNVRRCARSGTWRTVSPRWPTNPVTVPAP